MIFVFLFIFIAVATLSSYKFGYYSAELQRSKARINTISRMQYFLKTNAHSYEWFEGALWAIKDSYPDPNSCKKENNNVYLTY